MSQTELLIDRDVVYAAPEGVDLALDIVRPASERPLPVLMLVHGGGWCSGCRQDMAGLGHYFAARGYLTASVSYRLAPAYPFPAACHDVRAASAWLTANVGAYGGDAARLGAYGVSAGAHLVGWLAVQPRVPLCCAVAWAGPMDMLREPVTTPFRGYAFGFMASCPHDNTPAYLAASPITQITPRMPPLLLVHGLADDVVSPEHARWMADAAQQVAAPVEAIFLDGVGHTGGEAGNPLHAPGWQRMLDFFAQHLC